MRVYVWCAFLVTAVLFGAAAPAPRTALADAAPPPFALGGDVGPGGFPTHVRMVSERVLMTISDAPDHPVRDGGDRPSDAMIGHVTATFVMRNEGDSTESIDVRFPLQRDQYEWAISEGFAATVDGSPVEVHNADQHGLPFSDATGEAFGPEKWATWPATFPPGTDVALGVTYDVRPTGYGPYGTFGYVLDTGAGWAGTIGEAEVRVRLPYAANAQNLALDADLGWGTAVNPRGFKIMGTDITWHFMDLEPSASDNIRLTVLVPRLWTAVIAARAEVANATNPSRAQLSRLAIALDNAGVFGIGSDAALAAEARVAYERAIERAPGDFDLQIDDIVYRAMVEGCHPYDWYECYSDRLRADVERALARSPNDARLKDLAEHRAGATQGAHDAT
ncbi:MAG: hypothetical protein ABI652_06220, partial [Acidobacteriota bacterium]